MSNYPPEPREHDDRCALRCDYASLSIIEDSEYTCPVGHTVPHDCTCDALAEQDAGNEAEAFVDWIASDASVDASIADVLAGIRDRIRDSRVARKG